MNVAEAAKVLRDIAGIADWVIQDEAKQFVAEQSAFMRASILQMGGDPTSHDFLLGMSHGLLLSLQTIGTQPCPNDVLIGMAVLSSLLEVIDSGHDVEQLIAPLGDFADISKWVTELAAKSEKPEVPPVPDHRQTLRGWVGRARRDRG